MSKLYWRGYSSFYRMERHVGPILNIDESELSLFGVNDDSFHLAAVKLSSMIRRDYVIADALQRKGVTSVIDVGGDIGGLAMVLHRYGIDCVVSDPNPKCKNYVESIGIKFSNCGVEDYIAKNLFDEYDALCCLNYTHVPWVDEQLKSQFFDAINDYGPRIVVLSLIGDIPKNFTKYKEDLEFNVHSSNFNWLRSALSIFSRMGVKFRYLDHLIRLDEYTSMQRMLVRS